MTLEKADRRFKPERAQWSGSIPKHSEEAAAIRQAAGTKRLVPLGPAIRNGLRVTRIGKAAPTEARRAEAAQTRKKVGLGTAGVGYLVASRGKDVAPGIADLVTRSEKKIGDAKHTEVTTRRAAKIGRGSGKVGAAAVLGGLALGAEGLAADVRHRHLIGRTKETAKELMTKSAFGVEDERLIRKAGPGDSPAVNERRRATDLNNAAVHAASAGAAGLALRPLSRRAHQAAAAHASRARFEYNVAAEDMLHDRGTDHASRMRTAEKKIAAGSRAVRASARTYRAGLPIAVGGATVAALAHSRAKEHKQNADWLSTRDRVTASGLAKAVAASADEYRQRAASSQQVSDREDHKASIGRTVARATTLGGLGTAGIASNMSRRARSSVTRLAEDTAGRRATAVELSRARRLGRTFRAANRIGGPALGVATGGGLIAGSYANSHSQAAQDAHRASLRYAGKARKLEAPSVSKAYSPGEITYHQEQADMHSRKKASAGRGIAAGTALVGGGVAAGGLANRFAPDIARTARSAASSLNPGRVRGVVRAAGDATRVRRVATLGGLGIAATGAGVVAGSAVRRMYHGQRQNAQAAKAQAARRRRSPQLSKAFDPERSRHGRQSLYEGAAAGGAVVAGGAGVAAGRRAGLRSGASSRTAASAAANRAKGEQRLIRMTGRGNGSMPRTDNNLRGTINAFNDAKTQGQRAAKLAGEAKRFRRISGGAAAGSALLGATALGIHRHDRRGAGRTYGY